MKPPHSIPFDGTPIPSDMPSPTMARLLSRAQLRHLMRFWAFARFRCIRKASLYLDIDPANLIAALQSLGETVGVELYTSAPVLGPRGKMTKRARLTPAGIRMARAIDESNLFGQLKAIILATREEGDPR